MKKTSVFEFEVGGVSVAGGLKVRKRTARRIAARLARKEDKEVTVSSSTEKFTIKPSDLPEGKAWPIGSSA